MKVSFMKGKMFILEIIEVQEENTPLSKGPII